MAGAFPTRRTHTEEEGVLTIARATLSHAETRRHFTKTAADGEAGQSARRAGRHHCPEEPHINKEAVRAASEISTEQTPWALRAPVS